MLEKNNRKILIIDIYNYNVAANFLMHYSLPDSKKKIRKARKDKKRNLLVLNREHDLKRKCKIILIILFVHKIA